MKTDTQTTDFVFIDTNCSLLLLLPGTAEFPLLVSLYQGVGPEFVNQLAWNQDLIFL